MGLASKLGAQAPAPSSSSPYPPTNTNPYPSQPPPHQQQQSPYPPQPQSSYPQTPQSATAGYPSRIDTNLHHSPSVSSQYGGGAGGHQRNTSSGSYGGGGGGGYSQPPPQHPQHADYNSYNAYDSPISPSSPSFAHHNPDPRRQSQQYSQPQQHPSPYQSHSQPQSQQYQPQPSFNAYPGATGGAYGGYGNPAAAQAAQAQGGAPGGAGGYGAPAGAPPGQAGGGYGQPPQQQQQYGAPPGPPPGQAGRPLPSAPGGAPGGYGAPPGPPPGHPSAGYAPPGGPPPGYGGQQGQQQQGQYGQPPQQQQQGQYGQPQHGAPPGGAGGATTNAGFLKTLLETCVNEQRLQAFYPPGSGALDMIAAQVASAGLLDKIANEWRMPRELAADLVKLSLYDVVLYVDDSGSMAFEQGGERIDDLKLIMSRVAYATSLFDQDGISVRFMNSRVNGDGINSEAAALQLVQQIKFSGLTPLGTQLDQKIIQPLLLGPIRQNALKKPVLIIAITDGVPAGEPKDCVHNVIMRTNQELQRTRYGPGAVAYQFAQVGDDTKAQAFLSELDNHPVIGDLIDQTGNYESEQEEMMRTSGMDLSPELWLVKLCLGAIDKSYDDKDEKR